jgi:hypothetical protein
VAFAGFEHFVGEGFVEAFANELLGDGAVVFHAEILRLVLLAAEDVAGTWLERKLFLDILGLPAG